MVFVARSPSWMSLTGGAATPYNDDDDDDER
jgi:hypothetical protein